LGTSAGPELTTAESLSRTPSTSHEARGKVRVGAIELSWAFWPGRGPALVALHGITANAMSFVAVAERLAGRRPLLALDLRGRGESAKPERPYGMATHAADVAGAIEAFGLGPAIVLGHSMGGFVAVALAAEHPEAVAGLVLVDGGLPLEAPAGVPVDEVLELALAPQMERLKKRFASPEAYLAYWRDLPVFSGGRWNRFVEAYLRNDLAAGDHHYRPRASERAVRLDFLDTADAGRHRARLAALRVPVVLLRAAEGFNPGDAPLYPEETVRKEIGSIRDVRDHVLAGATHYTILAVADAAVALAEECGR
jgi:lipase